MIYKLYSHFNKKYFANCENAYIFVSQNKIKIKVMRKITVEEKHMIRKAQRQASDIRRMMLIDGVYKFKMTPNVTVKPYAFCNHTFTKGDDSE